MTQTLENHWRQNIASRARHLGLDRSGKPFNVSSPDLIGFRALEAFSVLAASIMSLSRLKPTELVLELSPSQITTLLDFW
jgi:hypothetical protein